MGLVSFGLQVSVLGMGTVFIILIILLYLITGLSLFIGKKKVNQSAITAPAAKTAISAPAATSSSEDESEIVAVIAAAIAACGGSGTVRTIKRIIGDGGTAWNTLGRAEIMDSRKINA